MADVPTHDVTLLLARWKDGDEAALQQLVPIVHDELRRLARRQTAGERPDHSLQPTALVNEAYQKRGGGAKQVTFTQSLEVTDGQPTDVHAANTRALSPRYAGDYLAFLSSKGGADGLWKIDNSGMAVELWKGGDGGVVAAPAISPDGNRICFAYRKQGRAELYVINANGTGLTTLATSIEVQSAASWSPDGKWVAVAANQGDRTRVFKIPLDGGPPIRLRDTLSFNPVGLPMAGSSSIPSSARARASTSRR